VSPSSLQSAMWESPVDGKIQDPIISRGTVREDKEMFAANGHFFDLKSFSHIYTEATCPSRMPIAGHSYLHTKRLSTSKLSHQTIFARSARW